MNEKTAKELLLAAVLDHFVSDGLGDMSLRKIATAVGTSHRMLLYHFGSKDGLLIEVVRAVEERTRAQLAEIAGAAGQATDQAVREMWQHVADPAQGDFERLFFALCGRALQGDERIGPLLGGIIDRWLISNGAVAAEQGIPPQVARTHARLGMAVTRGLLLDLLATGDRIGVDAALEVFARRYSGRWWDDEPPETDPTPVSARAS